MDTKLSALSSGLGSNVSRTVTAGPLVPGVS